LKKILIIDDDQGIRDALSELLEMEGYLVALAGNGSEGLRVLRQMESPPDLILLDFMMPSMDGFQFREMQVAERLHPRVPVVLMSADCHVEEKQVRGGMMDHLRKPMDISDVINMVKKHCA
jgi:CheY-like chemotaxis protein